MLIELNEKEVKQLNNVLNKQVVKDFFNVSVCKSIKRKINIPQFRVCETLKQNGKTTRVIQEITKTSKLKV